MTYKKDNGKADLSLCPLGLVEGAARAYAFGAEKYSRDLYRSGPGLTVTRCLASALRHVYAATSGETTDPESKLDHLDHAAAAIGMALELKRLFPSADDRWAGPMLTPEALAPTEYVVGNVVAKSIPKYLNTEAATTKPAGGTHGSHVVVRDRDGFQETIG